MRSKVKNANALRRLASIIALLSPAGLGPVSAAPPATLTALDIWRAAEEAHDRIKSVRVDYDVSWKKLLDIPSLRKTGIVLTPSHVLFKYDGERRYMRLIFANRPGSPPYIPFIAIFDGKNTYTSTTGFLSLVEGKERRCEDNEFYCHESLQIPYRDADRVQLDNAWFYPHCVRPVQGRSLYHVLKNQEQVGGAWCHVIEDPHRDRIWVDSSMGCTMRRREHYIDVQGKTIILYRDELSDFVEAAPGIWVPRDCVCQYFAGGDNAPEYWNRQYLERRVKVRDIAINQVTDRDYTLSVPSGTFLVTTTGSTQIAGDKTLLLNDFAELARTYLVEKEGRNWQRTLFLVCNVIVIAFVLGVLAWSVRKRRRARQGLEQT